MIGAQDLTVPLRGHIQSDDRKIPLRIKISATQLKAEQMRLRGAEFVSVA